MLIFTTIKRIVVMLLLLAACLSLTQGLNNAIKRHEGSQDFEWSPSRLLLEHKDPYATYLNYDGKAPYPMILSQAPNYPASGLILLWPYAMFKWSTAKALWAFSNVIFTVAILFCLFQLLPDSTSWTTKLLIVTLFLISTQWRNTLGNGQHGLFTLSFFLLAVIMYLKNCKGTAIPLGISWFKYTIGFPLSLFFARSKRGWVTIFIAAAIHAALTVFASVWVETSPFDLLLGPIQVAQSNTGKGYLDVFAVATELGLSSKIVPAIFAFIILSVTYIAILRDSDNLSCLSTLAMASMTVVFHLGYDFLVLVIPLSYALRERAINVRARYYLIVIMTIWFADKMVDYGVSNQARFSEFFDLLKLFFWIKVSIFYGALFADWFIAFKHPTCVNKA